MKNEISAKPELHMMGGRIITAKHLYLPLNLLKSFKRNIRLLLTVLGAVLATAFFAGSGMAQQGPGGEIPGSAAEALRVAANRRIAEDQIKRKWDSLGGAPGQQKTPGDNGLVMNGGGYYKPAGGGYFREYVGGGRIYYRPSDKAAFFVYGFIHDKYRQLGGPSSRLGWPTRDEEPFPDGGRVTTFEGGAIYWWPDTGAIEMSDIVVRYTGLYCFGETDESSESDEPYLIFSTFAKPPAPASVVRTKIYEDVDSRDSRVDSIELYRGLPYGVLLDVVMMEHDVGDPSREHALVKKGADKAAEKLAELSVNIPVVGPGVAVGLALLWEGVGGDVVDFLNDSLGFEDDKLDTKRMVISAKQMVTLARASRQNFRGSDIVWQIETPILSGDGGSYKAYFVIEPVGPPIEAVPERNLPIDNSDGVRPVPRYPHDPSLPTISKCESALLASARNSPAAPGLTAQCQATINTLAARGESVTLQDPAAVALRNRQPNDYARRGFDIGMAAAEGQTAPGPGKQAIHDSLPTAQQGGFTAAVNFSLARNSGATKRKYDELAAKGEALANQDPMAVELRNQQPNDSARRGFDIGMAVAGGDTAPGPGKQAIHDSLPTAEQPGFAAAVSYLLTRNSAAAKTKDDELAAKGEALANQDPMAVELRNQQPNDSARRGFDIGMAVAEGNTEPGPGKQAKYNLLPAAEQPGFAAAVSFTLARNKNRKLVTIGAAIAETDIAVAAARRTEADVLYRQGFDIATGLFGDPARGAVGNTLMGPGSMAIRDALSVAGQRGFNLSVKLHLGRKYTK
jgi:hypothetical protein